MRSAALGSQTRLGIEHSYPPMAPLEWLHVRSNGFRGAVRRDILPGFSHTEAITQTVEHLIRSTQGTGVASEEMSFILSEFFFFFLHLGSGDVRNSHANWKQTLGFVGFGCHAGTRWGSLLKPKATNSKRVNAGGSVSRSLSWHSSHSVQKLLKSPKPALSGTRAHR